MKIGNSALKEFLETEVVFRSLQARINRITRESPENHTESVYILISNDKHVSPIFVEGFAGDLRCSRQSRLGATLDYSNKDLFTRLKQSKHIQINSTNKLHLRFLRCK